MRLADNHQGGGRDAACVREHWPDDRMGRVNLGNNAKQSSHLI